jgi:hypothetical protein
VNMLMTFGFHKRKEISCLAVSLLASEERPYHLGSGLHVACIYKLIIEIKSSLEYLVKVQIKKRLVV